MRPILNCRSRILKALDGQGLTRASLVKKTGIPRTTLFDNLTILASEGLVCNRKLYRNQKGRPQIVWYKVSQISA
jgi:predicted ArsR family transcriptional regulator